MALVQAQQAPMPAADLLARYNQRPDAQLIIAPQWLSTASVPEVFPGQQLWQLLFDEERFQHPLSRSRHSHRRLGAYHWQWVIEPQQPWRGCFMLSVRGCWPPQWSRCHLGAKPSAYGLPRPAAARY